MRVAMVSEHASPLAVLGGVDAGGQNVHVAALAEGMARHGADVVVHTRRDDVRLPRVGAVEPQVLGRAGSADRVHQPDPAVHLVLVLDPGWAADAHLGAVEGDELLGAQGGEQPVALRTTPRRRARARACNWPSSATARHAP